VNNVLHTRLLLVDDQVLFVRSLHKLLEIDAPHMEVVGIAYDGQQAVDLARNTGPDVVLMDLRLPVFDGVEATRQIKGLLPDTRIVVLTKFDDDESIKDALSVGADGYLLKDIPPAELIASIEAIQQGGTTISPAIARKLVARAYPSETPSATEALWDNLNRRDAEILRMMADGYDNRDIAERLCLGLQTVKNYVSLLYDKLGVEKRSQAIQLVKTLRSWPATPSDREST